MIACPNCGGNTKFDIASQQILCEFCDTKFRGIYMPYWAYYFTQQGEFCINGKIGCSNFPFIKFIFNITSSVFLITSVIISFLIAIIYGVELNAIHRKENYEDDKGMQYKNASLKSDALNNVSPAKSGKKKGLIALGIAIIVSLAILFLHPIHDYLYYVGAILCLIAEFVTLVDLMGAYNLLATRRLPQFDKKGGDDRA